jgi:hypothetical protein
MAGPGGRRSASDRGPLPALAVVVILAAGLAGAAQPPAPLELAVKATYLVKLAPFVDWPAAALGEPHGPFVICVAGRDPFGALLDQAAAGQQVMDHPVVVRRLATVGADPHCQILFLDGAPAQSLGEALALVRNDAAATPGVIDFVLDHGRVRFRIDDAAAAAHGLVIRAQLLNLAVSVTPRKSVH